MNINVEVSSNINVTDIVSQIDNSGFWLFAANEWWRLISPYTPRDTGQLCENVSIEPKKINYKSGYAEDVYNTNKHYRKDKNPLATYKWDEVAVPVQGEKLVNSLAKYINLR